MSERLSDEQWRNILELANAAVKYPKSQRVAFLEAAGSSPDVIQQVLVLTEAFEQPAFSTDRIGSKVGHFLITEHLGHGGMGDVYAARDVELERKVALKFLNPESLGLEGAGEKFIREARTASALNHPNIVTIHEVIRSDSTVAIVMELVEGVPLRQLCGTPVPLKQLIKIAGQIAGALAAAHAAGVVHRDMKPENVMVRPDGHVKVLDFGLARRFGGDNGKRSVTTVTDVFAGTWRYMSPEQVKGDTLTGASDVFSFGLILYELATGRHPFQAGSPFETLQAIAGEEAAPPSKWNPRITKNLESLILAMLAKNPAARPSTDTIAQALADWETGSIDSRIHDSFGYRRTPRRLVWIGATVILLIALAVGFWAIYRPRNRTPGFSQVTTLVPENRATAAAISPDGIYTAYANIDGVFLRASQTGETDALRAPKDFLVDQLSWFASGTKLVASGFFQTTNQPSIWSISITGGEPRQLKTDARNGIPSPDGTRIAFITGDRSAIATMGATGEEPHQVIGGPAGDSFTFVIWTADGRHLAFQRRHYSGKQDLGIVMLDRYYQRSFGLVDTGTGKPTATLQDLWIQSAASLPDGRILFLRLKKLGSDEATEIWSVKADSNGALRGSPRKVADVPLGTRDRIFNMTATSDGKRLMVIRRTNQDAVFVADFSPSPPHFSDAYRLTLEQLSNFPHTWTADSNSVIFESDRSGSWDIFKQRIDQHTAETIIATPRTWDVLPQLAPDGKSILYAVGLLDHEGPPYTLMHISVNGGTPQVVPIGGALDEFRCAYGVRCVLRTTDDRQDYVFHELDPVRGIGRELARTAWLPSLVGDWTLSPDGYQAAIPNHDSRSGKIRIVSWKGHPTERELDVPGLTDLSELAWAADGKGWFVTIDTSIGTRLVYVDQDGRLFPLGDIQGWAVPSPNGRKVAYLNKIFASNAWTIDLR